MENAVEVAVVAAGHAVVDEVEVVAGEFVVATGGIVVAAESGLGLVEFVALASSCVVACC